MNEITKEQFESQRNPLRGRSNPELFDRAVWKWLVRSRLSAYQANERFGCPGPYDEGWTGPGWCFQRMGCTKTELPDGRIVNIAGEHEDSYDADFYIYNDVVVQHPDGRIDIYGYPEDVFPATDFHSATFDEPRNCIWVVGSLGYDGHRRPGETPVYRVCMDSFQITAVPASGEAPGWIHKHTGELAEDGKTLCISRGVRQHRSGAVMDQTDDWVLDLTSFEWRRATTRVFRQWSVRRADGDGLNLFEMDSLAFDLRYRPDRDPSRLSDDSELDDSVFAELNANWAAKLGRIQEHFDLEVYESLFKPPVAFSEDGGSDDDDDDDDDDWSDNTRFDHERIVIGDCRVRYANAGDSLKVKVEGRLDPDVESAVRDDLIAKLTRLQGVPCEAELEWEQ